MSQFDRIEDFITELYRHRKLLATLFDKRMVSVHTDTIMPMIDNDPQILERLDRYEIVHAQKSKISLNGRLREFFEDFMEADETIHVLYIQENLEKIRENQTYFMREPSPQTRERYLLKIKNHLRRIQRITTQNIKTLRRNTDEAYKGATSFDLKREKLNYLRQQRDALEELLRVVNRMLCDELFFRSPADDELNHIVHQLKVTLYESKHNLIEIQQQIIEYLNQIQFRAEIMKKVLQLKSLRDKFQLRELSNFYQVVESMEDCPLMPPETFRTRLSGEEMTHNPQMQELILRVRQNLSVRKGLEATEAGEIDSKALEASQQEEQVINLEGIKELFLESRKNLFAFVMEHEFPIEMSTNKRLGLYCRVASLFESDLQFTDQTQQWNDLEYAMIYSPNK